MTSIICDITKKVIPNAKREINYTTFKNKTLSMDAREQIEQKVKQQMCQKKTYTMKEYWDLFWETIEDMS